MGGLLSSLALYPFMSRGNITSGFDYNNAETGYYNIMSSDTTNSPGIGWGVLLSIKGTISVQVAFEANAPSILARTNPGTGWKSWYQFQLVG